jgi:predicted Zn finger-like uncharacterized protein
MKMFYATCPNCGAHLEVHKQEIEPGQQGSEEVLCPKCKVVAKKVFHPGIFSVQVRR